MDEYFMNFLLKILWKKIYPSFNRTLLIIILLLVLTGHLNAETDSGMRIHQNFKGKLSDYLSLHYYSFEQFMEDLSRYNYYETGVGAKLKLFSGHFALSTYYRQGYSRSDDNSWSIEKAPQVNIETGLTIKMIGIFEQARYEYRYKPEWEDYRLKNFLKISLPHIFLRPFVGWEIYYEHYYEEVNLHRFHAGMSENIYDGLMLGAYYRYDLSKADDKWEHIRNVYGVRVALSL
jgi:hypothetical protein